MDINYYLSIYIKHGVIITPLHLEYIILKDKFMKLSFERCSNICNRKEFNDLLDVKYQEVAIEMYNAVIQESLE